MKKWVTVWAILCLAIPCNAGIQFKGFKPFYMVDSEIDIDTTTWAPGTSIYSIATDLTYVMLANGVYYGPLLRTISNQSMSFVGTGATGTQISASKNSTVRFSVSTSVTATIGGSATSVVILKICSTNSATEGNWSEAGRVETDQSITLAIALQSVNLGAGQISAELPAGWFCKLVASGTGTHTETFISGQKTIYG